MFDLGFLGVEKDFLQNKKSSLPFKKRKAVELTKGKRVQQESFQKEDGDRTCYLQNKEIQNNE